MQPIKLKDKNSSNKIKKAHFIGIGGIGMSALARMLVHRGVTVSGSDSVQSDLTKTLEDEGISIVYEQVASNITDDIDLVVYTGAIQADNEELNTARKAGIMAMSYFETLGEVAKEYKVIAVTGTHGKTTTTAMTAQVLINAGVDPTVIVGSLVDFGSGERTNFRAGNSEYLLVEACEYKRHFLNFNPYILAITNIEFDHPDYYRDLKDAEDAFAELSGQSEIVLAQESIENHMLSVPELKVLGEHNRRNASLALAIVDALVVDLPDRQETLEKAKEALEKFSGSWRRFEYKGITTNGAKIYDDYAHHPTAIKATLAAVGESFVGEKIIAVFEPHMYSRTKEFWSDFATSFADADEVIIAPIYPAREESVEGITAEALAQSIEKYNPNTQSTKTLEQASELASQLAGKGDKIIFMSAGDIFKQIPKILQAS